MHVWSEEMPSFIKEASSVNCWCAQERFAPHGAPVLFSPANKCGDYACTCGHEKICDHRLETMF